MQGKNVEKIVKKNKPACKTDNTRRERKAARETKQINLFENVEEDDNASND